MVQRSTQYVDDDDGHRHNMLNEIGICRKSNRAFNNTLQQIESTHTHTYTDTYTTIK